MKAKIRNSPALSPEVISNRFLTGFTPKGRERLIGSLLQQTFPAGAFLFREGDAATGVYLVLSGEIEIVKSSQHHEAILGCLSTGSYLGEVGVLDGQGRSTDARAKTAVTVATIPAAVLLKVLASEPVALTMGLLQNALGYLRHTNNLFAKEVAHNEKLSLVGEMTTSFQAASHNVSTDINFAAELMTLPEMELVEKIKSDLGQSLILLNRNKEILCCQEPTRRLIHSFFEGAPGTEPLLPDAVRVWLDQAKPSPLKREYKYDTLELRFYRDTVTQRYLILTQISGPFLSIARLIKLGLSPRESEVLYWLAQGKRNEEIALILEVSFFTIKTHLKNIFRRLGVETRTAAAAMAAPFI